MLTLTVRMLEDPSYEKIVRWGEGGQSFVVLEVRCATAPKRMDHFQSSNYHVNTFIERKIHQICSTEALQALQLRKLRPTVEQVRLPQGQTEQRR